MNELLASTALREAGELDTKDPSVIVYTINGHRKKTKPVPLTKILRAVCKHHAVWLLNNIGKRALALTGKHGQAREHCGGNLQLTAEDVACFKAVLARLGTTVQLAERFVLIDGVHHDVRRKCTTLRIGELLYIHQSQDGEDASAPIAALAQHAALELIPRIFQQGQALETKKKEVVQKEKKKTNATAAKKRRFEATSQSTGAEEIPLEQEASTSLEIAE